jgi:hypothetical protein
VHSARAKAILKLFLFDSLQPSSPVQAVIMVLPHVLLVPPLMEKDELEAFNIAGNSVSTAVSPRSNSLAVFAAATDVGHPPFLPIFQLKQTC